MEDIREKQPTYIEILCDKKSAIYMAKNSCLHSRTRHIAIKYHFIREAIEENEIRLGYCKSQDQMANVLTKGTSNNEISNAKESIES